MSTRVNHEACGVYEDDNSKDAQQISWGSALDQLRPHTLRALLPGASFLRFLAA